MKLFIAITGNDREDCLKRLQKALDNDAEFTENNCYIEHITNGQVDYILDFQFEDTGDFNIEHYYSESSSSYYDENYHIAMLADLI
jgi:hypothetical protein